MRLPLFLHPISSQIRDPSRIWDIPFPLFLLRAERRADQRGREDLQEGLQPGKPGKIPERSRYPDGPDGNFGILRVLLVVFGILGVLPRFFGILGFFPLWIPGCFGILSALLGIFWDPECPAGFFEILRVLLKFFWIPRVLLGFFGTLSVLLGLFRILSVLLEIFGIPMVLLGFFWDPNGPAGIFWDLECPAQVFWDLAHPAKGFFGIRSCPGLTRGGS